MVSKTLSQLIGEGGGGLIMPSFTVKATAGVNLKTNLGTVVAANAAGFWTAVDLSHTPQGWESVKLAAAANTTEQTILDITDEGVLTHVVAPELSGSGTMTIRVTADGVVTTYISETIGAGARFCIGHILGVFGNSAATGASGISSGRDPGFDDTVDYGMVTTPLQALQEGKIGIPFKTALKVTIQGSVNISGTAQLLNACANHSLFIPEGVA